MKKSFSFTFTCFFADTFPSFLLVVVSFWPIIILPLSEEFPLTFFARQIYWQQIVSIVVCQFLFLPSLLEVDYIGCRILSFWIFLCFKYFTPLPPCLEKAKAPQSSTLAWKIPWTEEPGGLQSMGSLGVGHDWVTSLSLFTFMQLIRKWQPTPVFLPGESQGRGSLVGRHLRGHTESDTTEVTQQQQQPPCLQSF